MLITDTPGIPFYKIALNIVGPLPKIPLVDITAVSVADAFIKRFISIFGSPKVILTDQGSNFMSSLMKRLSKRFKIKQIKTTPYHAQSNGSLDRSHHVLKEFLKQYTVSDDAWDEWVDLAILNYNTSVQESTKLTPYEIIFGRIANLPTSLPLRESDLLPTYQGYMKDLVVRLNSLQKIAYDNLMEGVIILCCLIVVALSSPQLYLNEKIEDNPGIYYEKTENIRYYAASWDIVVFIDTYELHKILPEMRRAIAFTTKTCKDPEMCSKSLHRIKHIENRIELLDLHFNRTLSSLYNIPPRQPVDNLKNLQKRSVPFGFIGNAAKYLFGTLTEEDSEKYDDQIKDLQSKQLELARIGKDDSHLIHNKLNDITKRIQKEKNDIKKAMIELNKTAYYLYSLSSDYYRWSYLSDVNLALNEVESVLNLFDDTLRNLLDIISYAKVNLLHPELITPEQLHKVIRQIEDHGKDLEFPIPIDSACIEKLSNLADISLGYHDDNLIFHVNIPLLEKHITNLYKMHPLPIPQNLQGIYIATSIRPRWKYIAINEHSKVYSFLNEDDLQNCKHDKRRKVCPKKHMMIEMSSKADCEYLLLHKPSLVNFSECDVVITHEKRDTWIHLDSVNGWLYSLKENHSLLITCEKGMTYVILKGAGILQLKPKCQAKYKDISITQQEGIGESVQYFYMPHVSLNISILDPKLPEKVNLVLPSMTEEYLDDSTEIDMKEIQRRYDQLTEETSTDKLHKYTTYGSLLTLLILMIFAGIAIFIIYKLNEQYRFEIRQKTNSPLQVNVSTQSLNEMEQ
ncbi:hypothetical protein TKK_0016083 [Trichogramma kaykai]